MSTFVALRHRDFRLLWIGLVTSGVGGSMQQFGLGWFVVQIAVREGQPQLGPLYLGLVGLSRGVPGIAFGLFGGVLADRMDRRKLLTLTRFAAAVVSAVLAALTFADVINLAWIMAVTLLGTAFTGFDGPTRQAITPRLVPEKDLMSAVGLNTATLNFSGLFGPLLGGVAIIPVGVGGLMAIAAAGHLVAVACLLGMPAVPVIGTARQSNLARSLVEGFAFVLREPVLRWVMGLNVLGGLLGRSVQQLFPAVAENVLGVGPTELSWMLFVAAAGGLAGSMVGASLGGFPRKGILLAGAVLTWGLFTLAFAEQRTLPGALLFCALPSASQYLYNNVSYFFVQTRSPDRLRARAVSIYQLGSTQVNSFGAFLLGFLGSLWGIETAIAVGGLVLASLALLALVRPTVRDLGLAPAPVAAPAPR